MSASRQKAEDLLPLTPAVFHILLSLATGERHGYAIMAEVGEATDGKIRLGPGTLYGTIKRLPVYRIARHCCRTAADLVFSASREHAANQSNKMKNLTPSKTSAILLIAAILLQQAAASLTFSGYSSAIIFLWFGTLALVGRGVCEVMRPASEWRRALVWALAMALMYSLICPVWGHLAEKGGLSMPISLAFKAHLFGFLINLVVPLVKTAVALLSRPKA